MNENCSRNDKVALESRGIERRRNRAPKLTASRRRADWELQSDPQALDIIARAVRVDPRLIDLEV